MHANFFLDLEIICPNDTKVIVNHLDTVLKNFSWSKPKVINRKNGTNFSVEVEPSWAVPPADFPSTGRTVITYFARHEYGKTINCSFTITVLNDTCEFGCRFINFLNVFFICNKIINDWFK